jgi:hypothetical protein
VRGHPDIIKDAAACHLRLQCDLKGWDKVLHLVHGHILIRTHKGMRAEVKKKKGWPF